MKNCSEHIRETLEDILKQDEIHYTVSDSGNLIRIPYSIDCKLKEATVVLAMTDNHYTSYGVLPINADEDCRAGVMEYLTRANYGLARGNFEMDADDGAMRYKFTIECGEDGCAMPDIDMVRMSILLPLNMIERYADGLLAVMYNLKTPAEAVRDCEAK